MQPLFDAIVATGLGDIAADLDRAAGGRTASHAEQHETSALPPPLVDISRAERLASGALLFPMQTGSSFAVETSWHVFAQRAGASSGPAIFDEVGVITAATCDDDFVEIAYRSILDRNPDPTGHRAYRETLQSGQQTRRGVLRDLAGSDEAAERGRQLLIMTGGWLGASDMLDVEPPHAVRVDFDTSG